MAKFSARSTGKEVASTYDAECWASRAILITGTTHGIGFETLRAFVSMRHAPILILANRNEERAKSITQPLIDERPDIRIHFVTLDLNSLQSVHACVEEIRALAIPLNVIVCNAGVFLSKYQESVDKYEKHFAINHLGHFVLVNELIPCLEEGAAKTSSFLSRVVVVSSGSHHFGEINFNQLPLSIDSFGSVLTQKAYAQSKLCNVLFANQLNRLMIKENLPIRANSLHPATMTGSNLGSESSLVSMVMKICSYFTRSLEQAAATSLYCSLATELERKGGRYYDECEETEMSDNGKDEQMAKTLWEISAQLALKN